jgi:hypothetical protein
MVPDAIQLIARDALYPSSARIFGFMPMYFVMYFANDLCTGIGALFKKRGAVLAQARSAVAFAKYPDVKLRPNF